MLYLLQPYPDKSWLLIDWEIAAAALTIFHTHTHNGHLVGGHCLSESLVPDSESGFINNGDDWRDQGRKKYECTARGGIDRLYHRSPPALDNCVLQLLRLSWLLLEG